MNAANTVDAMNTVNTMSDVNANAANAMSDTNANAMFEIRNLSMHFPLGKMKTPDGGRRKVVLKAVHDLSFEVMDGECLGVVGESGSGKSTLARCILKLLQPTSGEIIYDGKDITTLAAPEMKKLRREMQMVFQNPRSSFNPKMQVKNILSSVARFYGMDRAATAERIDYLSRLMSIGDDITSHKSAELSGGQLQRLALVRALIPSPRFLIADEALSALDVSVQAQILDLFFELKQSLGLTMLFISHDLTVVEYLCDRAIVLYLGRIMETASADALFNDPKHPYTKSLIAAKPAIEVGAHREPTLLRGEVPDAVNIPEGCRFCIRCPDVVEGLCERAEPEITEVSKGHFVACHLYHG
ncbi:MAG: ABC transporter ATP-binding protein [Clostridiales Family XIII bacterium]|jgi:peptide/nickel transport system ATP-binding protein/oligopeptide transport system ATP-binding protein|nr:ABC transporter ATP-binding protein [Clostridiales Family XIII bacterium]